MAHTIESPIPTITTSHAHMLITSTTPVQSPQEIKSHDRMEQLDISGMGKQEAHKVITEKYGDIFFRFITIDEAKILQGFPEDYVLIGSKADQLRHIGNSVVPLMAKKLIESNMWTSQRKARSS